jgi:hypothetical protein
MLIHNDKKYVETAFANEEEIESVVLQNYEYLFGSSSFIIPKKMIKTSDGSGTIPDGFAIDIEKKIWYLVEVELAVHPVWGHIAPQVSKQLIASRQEMTRKLLVELAMKQYQENDYIKEIFLNESIEEIFVHKMLNEIFEKPPIIGLPIDRISTDLKEWAASINAVVKLWQIKKYSDLTNPNSVIYDFPEEFRPTFSTEAENIQIETERNIYEINVQDLLKSDLLTAGEELYLTYKPRGGELKKYTSIINEDGSFNILGKRYESPSIAAIVCIQDAGSSRKTENGWRVWKNRNGVPLQELRDKLLK